MKVDRLDHLVLTVADLERTCAFYNRVLGMDVVTFGNRRMALAFGQQKINLHLAGHELTPRANRPVPGSADLCFITSHALPDVITHLARHGVAIEEGPVERTRATAPIRSVYIRDPDQNLIEIANY